MPDIEAFERQVAAEVRRAVGPEQAVDEAAVLARARAGAPRPLAITSLLRVPGREPNGGLTMLSAMKLVAATAILALTGGLLWTVLPGPAPVGEPLPAVEGPTESAIVSGAVSAWVTADVSGHQLIGSQGRRWLDGRTTYPEEVIQARQLSPDPRFEGTLTNTYNLYQVGDGDALAGGAVAGGGLVAGTMRLENDAGAWQGTYLSMREPEEPWSRHTQVLLEGEGAYAGLRALLQYDGSLGEGYSHGGSEQVKGFVFDGAMPTVPGAEEG